VGGGDKTGERGGIKNASCRLRISTSISNSGEKRMTKLREKETGGQPIKVLKNAFLPGNTK
jgi:hypothetical protein